MRKRADVKKDRANTGRTTIPGTVTVIDRHNGAEPVWNSAVQVAEAMCLEAHNTRSGETIDVGAILDPLKLLHDSGSQRDQPAGTSLLKHRCVETRLAAAPRGGRVPRPSPPGAAHPLTRFEGRTSTAVPHVAHAKLAIGGGRMVLLMETPAASIWVIDDVSR